jgi:hypothetical protein
VRDETMLWHYTIWTGRAELILELGVIRPATELLGDGAKPAVWFSRNEVWERSAAKTAIRNFGGKLKYPSQDAEHRDGGGLWRFGVDEETAPHGWGNFLKLSGASARTRQLIEDAARDARSNVHRYRCTFEEVPRDRWVAVEKWSGQQWADAGVL